MEVRHDLWRLGMTWDEPVPDDIAAVWNNWQANLHYITEHPVPRCYHHPDQTKRQIQFMDFPMHPTLLTVGWCISTSFIRTHRLQ